MSGDDSAACESFNWNETLKVNEDLKFTNKFNTEEDSVETTLWVKLTAFTCPYKLGDIKKWNFTLSNTEEEDQKKMCQELKKEKVAIRETTVLPEATKETDNNSDNLVPNEESTETNNGNTADSSDQDDKGEGISEDEETSDWHNTSTTILRKWKQYNLKIIVVNEDGNVTETQVKHDTLEWSCKDGKTKIPRIKICNHIPDCPGGEDEGEVCTPSALPRKLSFLCYAFMATVIIIYIFWKTCGKKTRHTINTKNTTENVTIDEKKVFLSRYKEAHVNKDKFLKFVSEVKFSLYKAGSPEKTAQVSQWARMAEQQLHPKAKQRYHCILRQINGRFNFSFHLLCHIQCKTYCKNIYINYIALRQRPVHRRPCCCQGGAHGWAQNEDRPVAHP